MREVCLGLEMPAKETRLSDILDTDFSDDLILTPKLWAYLQNYKARNKAMGRGFGYTLADLGGRANTLSARYYKDGAEILIPCGSDLPRKLSVRECARLQGFPDDYRFVVADQAAYRGLGNAVAVPVVRFLLESFRTALLTGSP